MLHAVKIFLFALVTLTVVWAGPGPTLGDSGLAPRALDGLPGGVVGRHELQAEPRGQELDPETKVYAGTPGTDLAQWPVYAAESVILPDERVQVTDTTVAYPRWIAHLEIDADGLPPYFDYQCTGFFVGPQVVATAGHCVYNSAFGGDNWADYIRVNPGRDGASAPFGSQFAQNWASVAGWTVLGNPLYDYGLIVLPDETLHDQVGSLGIAVLSDAELTGRSVNLAGYPGDKPFGTMWLDSDPISDVDPLCVAYEIDTYGGQSGAPVWSFENEYYQVVGIHTYAAPSNPCNSGDNSGTRITAARADFFESEGAYTRSVDPGVVVCHTLTKNVSPGGGGSIKSAPPNSGGCPSGTYASGTVVDLDANADSGYDWSSWSGTDNDGINPTTVTMTGNHTVTAHYVSAATPTPTPTITATPTCVAPCAGLDFSLGIDSDGDTVDDCSSKDGASIKCTLDQQSTFQLKFYLNSLPSGVPDYEGFDMSLEYAGVDSKDNATADPWPDCAFPAAFYDDGVVAMGCAVFGEASTYTGLMATNDFNCTESGTITMVHGPNNTDLVENAGRSHYEGQGTTESLTVNCASTPTPTNTPTATPTQTPTPETPTPTPTVTSPFPPHAFGAADHVINQQGNVTPCMVGLEATDPATGYAVVLSCVQAETGGEGEVISWAALGDEFEVASNGQYELTFVVDIDGGLLTTPGATGSLLLWGLVIDAASGALVDDAVLRLDESPPGGGLQPITVVDEPLTMVTDLQLGSYMWLLYAVSTATAAPPDVIAFAGAGMLLHLDQVSIGH